MIRTIFITALLASCLLSSSINAVPVTSAGPTHSPSTLQSRQDASTSSKDSLHQQCAFLKIRPLDGALLAKVKRNLAMNSKHSWVSGTRMQALLELDTPEMAVYHPAYRNIASKGSQINKEVDDIASSWLNKLPGDAYAMVVGDEAVGDAASLGVGFINASRKPGRPQGVRDSFDSAARRNVDYLLKRGKRNKPNGAISHRHPKEPFQAWSDNLYMVPPFLAYWGSIHNDITVAKEAFNQIKTYRDVLVDHGTNYWRHVSNNTHWAGEDTVTQTLAGRIAYRVCMTWFWLDNEFWGTGMAWATAGMSRVLATYKYSPFAGELGPEMRYISAWANNILTAVFNEQNAETALLPNDYGVANAKWGDTASSALFAASVYRLALLKELRNEKVMLARAGRIRRAIRGALDKETGWMWAADPLKWYSRSGKSAESMAFVLLMEAAARDFSLIRGCGPGLLKDADDAL